MERILFVEVRDKTRLFAAVASELLERSIVGDVGWIVQNAEFGTGLPGRIYRIPYPTRRVASKFPCSEEIADRLNRSDRNIRFYGLGDWYFGYYAESIERVLEEFRPDCVFGEVGNFHSHIASMLCERRRIPFLNPMLSRYPTGRFAFYLYDRFLPVGGSGEAVTDVVADAHVDAVVARRVVPEYMRRQRLSRASIMSYKGRLLVEYFRGERFNTRGPIEHSLARIRVKRLRAQWNGNAIGMNEVRSGVRLGRRFSLYPMQMQPELNLDVWGSAHNDQLAVLRLIEGRLGENEVLLVKANPKFSLEVTDELLDFASRAERIQLLAEDVAMRDIEPVVSNVWTVTGTVGLERALSRRPVTVLCDDYRGFIENGVDSPTDLMRRLIETSHRGSIGEPIFYPGVLNPGNVEDLVKGFEVIVRAGSGPILAALT